MSLRSRFSGFVARSLQRLGVGGEGTWRGPFFGVTEFGNWRPLGPLDNGWQKYLTLDPTLAHR